MKLILKAALPQLPGLPTKTRSKEFDAIQRTLRTMVDEHIERISWKEFQQKFQQVAKQYPELLTKIRKNQPTITQQDLKQWLDSQTRSDKYPVTYQKYKNDKESYRKVEQLVMQLNRGAEAQGIIELDSVMKHFIDFIGQSAAGPSGHPVRVDTVGWIRLDFVNQEYLLVDEVQSDLVNGVSTAQAYLQAPSFQVWYDSQTEGVKRKIEEANYTQNFTITKRNMQQMGWTVESLSAIKTKLIELFKDWSEHALSTILEIAREQGIAKVAIHSAEGIAQRDPSVDATKIIIYYDNLAKSFGFKKEQVNTPELSGTFWVRKARVL